MNQKSPQETSPNFDRIIGLPGMDELVEVGDQRAINAIFHLANLIEPDQLYKLLTVTEDAQHFIAMMELTTGTKLINDALESGDLTDSMRQVLSELLYR